MQAEPRLENGRLITEADERRPVCLSRDRWRKPDGSITTIASADTARRILPTWAPTRAELLAILRGQPNLETEH